ncbi:MAG: glycosyltransferase family 2 protein [Selenomonas sp.]|nr:glycosyltransferase family 2 protein [Selenomonas sp.]
MKTISIVVPVYNEEANLEHFTQAIYDVMAKLSYEYELIFVDDGSRDSSRAVLQKLQDKYDWVKPLLLSRNCGHQIAITCGMDHATGDAVITMDGDMQHPPALIPTLLKLWEKGYDVVQTIREATEGVSWFKKITSKYYYRFLNAMSETEVYPGGSDFRLLDRQACDALCQYREHDRFIRGMVGTLGFNQVQVPFTAPERFAGYSKFSVKKMSKLAMDGILGYSVVPLRISFYLGGLCALFSLILFAHVIVEYLLGNVLPGWTTIMVCVALFSGVQLMLMGVMGEYVGRIFKEVKNRPLYMVMEKRGDYNHGRTRKVEKVELGE